MTSKRLRQKPRDVTADDKAIGERLRIARNTAKLSQSELGDRLGVSFQQIQKYEKGVNRIAGGRLQMLAAALKVPVTYFFDQAKLNGGKSEASSEVMTLLTDRDVLKLCGILLGIQNRRRRAVLIDVAQVLADAD